MRRALSLLSLSAVASGVITAATLHGSVGAADAFTKQTLHFAVVTGPNNDQKCDIVGDLYTPAGASATSRVPAILATNGFGGSKDDFTGFAPVFARRGYEVLAYSGLGFGGSGCKITLDDPDYDGKAGSQLVSYLGGAPGIAFLDAAHTQPAPTLDVVVHDRFDHHHARQQFDPRVGMIGGSYGGQIQFAIAGVDPRLDTIIPLITWNDLSYSLGPNNTDQTTGVSSATPGAIKLGWGLGFSAVGFRDGLDGAQSDPSRLTPCPNFADWVCPALVTAGSTGFFLPQFVDTLRHASVVNYMANIRIPVLLGQGENDTLFNLNEATATYNALKAQGTPVKMIWHSWGHSGSTPAPGEWSWSSPDPRSQYEALRFSNWFDHYLKGIDSADTGPNFAYFRPWVQYSGIATPAFATAASPVIANHVNAYLSGDKTLVGSASAVAAGMQAFTTPGAGLPTSIDPVDALIGGVNAQAGSTVNSQPEQDLPGTAAAWTTPTLTQPLNVVGSPTLSLAVSAPDTLVSERIGPAGMLVLYVKIEDVGPDGKAYLINGDMAPVRIPNASASFVVRVPAMVHQFAPGHQLRLVVAGGSPNYRGSVTPHPVVITSGPGQVLTLPTVS